MPKLNPFIHFNGNAEEAFTFYRSVFGGEFQKIVRFKDLPENPDNPFTEAEADKIMHIALPIGKTDLLLGSDVPSFMGEVNENENRSKISVSTESEEEANQLFNGLSKDGYIEVPLESSPENSYFGMLRDKFGIEWMIEFDPDK